MGNWTSRNSDKVSDDFLRPVEDLAHSADEYKDLKLDAFKLKMVEGLSLSFARYFTVFLIMLVIFAVLATLALAGTLYVGHLLDNYALGALFVAAVFGLLLIILFAVRQKLFVNFFVKLFVKAFYDEPGK